MNRFNKQFTILTASILLSLSAQAQTLPEGFTTEVLVENLNTPVSFTQLPDSRFITLEQYTGNVLLVNATTGSRDSLFNIPDLNASGGNERGLLSVTIDPEFSANGFVYFYYTAEDSQVKITRYTLSKNRMDSGSRLEILNGIPDNAWNHNGGTLRFDSQGYLYLSLGDDASSCLAQDLSDPRGSILKMDLSKIPADAKSVAVSSLVPPNAPHSDQPGTAALIWHHGLRNPFRFDIDPVTGGLFIADVGLLDFEEIDFASQDSRAVNFGWPFFEGPAGRGQPGCARDENTFYTPPIDYYDRTGFQASVISLCVYRADSSDEFFWGDEYQGAYFYAEYFKGFIRCIRQNADGEWERHAPLADGNWGTGVTNIPEALVGSDGAVYYLRQFNDQYAGQSGQLCRIIPQK